MPLLLAFTATTSALIVRTSVSSVAFGLVRVIMLKTTLTRSYVGAWLWTVSYEVSNCYITEAYKMLGTIDDVLHVLKILE